MDLGCLFVLDFGIEVIGFVTACFLLICLVGVGGYRALLWVGLVGGFDFSIVFFGC